MNSANMKYCKCSKNIKPTELFHHYKIPPPLEPKYGIKKYSRKIFKCKICGHFSARHKIKVSEFYKKNYSLISHGKKMRIKFDKIINLKSKSDNYHRVRRFLLFFNKFKKKKKFFARCWQWIVYIYFWPSKIGELEVNRY